eukprot:CAMPEP_0197552380 /NCGR_PEP_ID=MMETSP1320-20131121/5893_1 /TAXON_ID=91990 /ORGANISM="Bolidomonas sp., Strain RCC2347" /LENGTH=604 /DNA_ID=CAMNT_0043112959 /DNA_START=179 /DNA_END=1993 /DNA_ORIENTATION=+
MKVVNAKGSVAEPKFLFLKQLREINSNVPRVAGFKKFMCRWYPLVIMRTLTAISAPVAVMVLNPDLDEGLDDTDMIVFSIVGILNIFGRLTPFATKYCIDEFKEKLQEEQATKVVQKVFEMQHGAILTTPTGEFSQILSKVFRNLDVLLPSLYGDIIPMIIETLVAVVFICVGYGFIGAIQLALFLVYTLLSYRAAQAKAERNKEFMTALFSEWGKIVSVAGSYERAHFFNNVEHEVNVARTSFEKMGSKIKAVSRGEHKEAMVLQTVSLTITAVFLGVVLAALGDEVGGLERAALAFYFFTYIGSLDVYAIGISNLRTGVLEYQTFNEFVNRRSEVKDEEGAVDLEVKENPAIEFENVSFKYGEKTILDDVSFKIEGGGTLGIVGSSGCGKSTIMRLLLRFYRPSNGIIKVDGVDISKVKSESLRRLFSVVTQDAALQNASIRDNIGYGKMGSSDDDILDAAKSAELHLKESEGGKGENGEGEDNDLTLDKICGEKGAKLSGGQQQRVALARAMLKKTRIYLLDEPTTGLDGVVARKLQGTLLGLSKNATTVMITHHLEDLKSATHILYLDSGKIVEEGAFNELMKAKGIFYQQVQARKLSVA